MSGHSAFTIIEKCTTFCTGAEPLMSAHFVQHNVGENLYFHCAQQRNLHELFFLPTFIPITIHIYYV